MYDQKDEQARLDPGQFRAAGDQSAPNAARVVSESPVDFRFFLHQRLQELHREERGITALLEALPLKLSPDADGAMCRLLINRRR